MNNNSVNPQNKIKLWRILLVIIVGLGLSLLLPMPLNPWAVYFLMSQYEEDGITPRKTPEQIKQESLQAEKKALSVAQQALATRRHQISDNSIFPTGEVYKVYELSNKTQSGYWIWGAETGKLGIVAVNNDIIQLEELTNLSADKIGGVIRSLFNFSFSETASLLLLGDFFTFQSNEVPAMNFKALKLNTEGWPNPVTPNPDLGTFSSDFLLSYLQKHTHLAEAVNDELIFAIPRSDVESNSLYTTTTDSTLRPYLIYSLKLKGEINSVNLPIGVNLRDLRRVKSISSNSFLIEGSIDYSKSKNQKQSLEKFPVAIFSRNDSDELGLDLLKTELLNKNVSFPLIPDSNGILPKFTLNTFSKMSSLAALLDLDVLTNDYFYRGILVARAHSLRTHIELIDTFGNLPSQSLFSLSLPATSLSSSRKKVLTSDNPELDYSLNDNNILLPPPEKCLTQNTIGKPAVYLGAYNKNSIDFYYKSNDQWSLAGELIGTTPKEPINSIKSSHRTQEEITYRKYELNNNNNISTFKKDFPLPKDQKTLKSMLANIDAFLEKNANKLIKCETGKVSAFQPGFFVLENEIKDLDKYKILGIFKNPQSKQSKLKMINAELFEPMQNTTSSQIRNIRFLDENRVWITGKFRSKDGKNTNSWVLRLN